jgi:hypothetical protein
MHLYQLFEYTEIYALDVLKVTILNKWIIQQKLPLNRVRGREDKCYVNATQ